MQYFYGMLLLGRPDRQDEAVARFQRATEISPDYAIAWNALGQAYLNTFRWERAITAFQRGIRLDPAEPYLHNNLGLAYAALGRWDEAMAAFREAVALKPDLAQFHRNLGDVYAQKGWTEATLAERALELNPADPLAWLQAGTTFLQLRWPAEALGALQEAVRLDPALREAHLRLAELYTTQLHDPVKAQAHLQKAGGESSRPEPLPGAGK